MKLIMIIYLTHYIQNNIISTYNQYENVNEIIYILFFLLLAFNIYLTFTSQIRLATYQVLNSYTLLVAPMLDSTDLEHISLTIKY